MRYECKPGYRYQDGTRQKTSQCRQMDNRTQWNPIIFPDCLRKLLCSISTFLLTFMKSISEANMLLSQKILEIMVAVSY